MTDEISENSIHKMFADLAQTIINDHQIMVKNVSIEWDSTLEISKKYEAFVTRTNCETTRKN